MKPTTFAIVGCGKVGVTFSWHLARRGFEPVGFASRSMPSAHAAREAAGRGDVFRDAGDATAGADLVFITTPDGAIASTAERLTAQQAFKPGAVVLHCSGALSSRILAPVHACGAHAGSLHPLQSFAAPTFPDNPFRGIVMAGEGDGPALSLAEYVAITLKADFLPLQTENKILYHAAAVVASNYLVTLMAAAGELLEASGIDTADVLKVLMPLVRGTLNNIEMRGIAGALTGPIARGDKDTVAAHCRKIRQALPELLPLYALLGAHTLPLATARGELDAAAVRQLASLLSSPA